ncbi:MAG: hypothetical protein ACK5TE_01795 [Pseudomonadota bacterium]
MAERPEDRMPEPVMDGEALCREEIYTDGKVGTLRCLVPVKLDGSQDPARPMRFVGEAQILTPAGALPLSFDVPGGTLAEAVVNYADAAREGIERAVREIQEMRRQAASGLVIPKGPIGPGGMPGAGGGGGRIQMP